MRAASAAAHRFAMRKTSLIVNAAGGAGLMVGVVLALCGCGCCWVRRDNGGGAHDLAARRARDRLYATRLNARRTRAGRGRGPPRRERQMCCPAAESGQTRPLRTPLCYARLNPNRCSAGRSELPSQSPRAAAFLRARLSPCRRTRVVRIVLFVGGRGRSPLGCAGDVRCGRCARPRAPWRAPSCL